MKFYCDVFTTNPEICFFVYLFRLVAFIVGRSPARGRSLTIKMQQS